MRHEKNHMTAGRSTEAKYARCAMQITQTTVLLTCAWMFSLASCRSETQDGPHDALRSDGGADAGVDGAPAPLLAIASDMKPIVLSVFAQSKDDVWFVGGEPSARRALVARLRDGSVRRIRAPEGPTLWWVHGFSDGTAYACGEGGRVLHFRDGVWVAELTGLDARATLWGIWGASPEDVWAVGGSLEIDGPKAIVIRKNGNGRWVRVGDPTFPKKLNFFKVWGASRNDVHLVGEKGLAIHFDGSGFGRADADTDEMLFTVHGRSGGPTLAVGGVGRGRVFRFESNRWIDDLAIEVDGLNGVFVRDDGTAIASGMNGTLLVRSAKGTWSEWAQSSSSGIGDHTFHAVSALRDVWAVGGRLSAGRDGIIATNRSPRPALDVSPLPVEDAGVRDAEVSDAATDGGIEDVARAGPGEPCTACVDGYECLGVAAAGYEPFCLKACGSATDCTEFGASPCCQPPGPQLLESYCMPLRIFDAGTCPPVTRSCGGLPCPDAG